MINFKPSARGCNKPKGPALFGPGRSCKMAATFLSPKVVYKVINKVVSTIMTIKINFSIIIAQSNASSVILYVLGVIRIIVKSISMRRAFYFTQTNRR